MSNLRVYCFMDIKKEGLQTKSTMKSENFLFPGKKKAIKLIVFLLFYLEKIYISYVVQVFMFLPIFCVSLMPNMMAFGRWDR